MQSAAARARVPCSAPSLADSLIFVLFSHMFKEQFNLNELGRFHNICNAFEWFELGLDVKCLVFCLHHSVFVVSVEWFVWSWYI